MTKPSVVVRFFHRILSTISEHVLQNRETQTHHGETQITNIKEESASDLKPNNEKDSLVETAKANIRIKQGSSYLNLSTLPIDDEETFDYALRQHKDPNTVTDIELQNRIDLPMVPISIGLFENLIVLNLRNNHINDLPWSIVYLKKLEKFDISYNMLTSLPRTIGHLTSLKSLNLEANHLCFLPTDLLRLQNLQCINLQKNHNLQIAYGNLSKELNRASLTVMLENQRNRSNIWSNSTPYYIPPDSNDALKFTCTPKELLDIAVDCILQHNVDYLSIQTVPTSVKNFLNDKCEETEHKLDLSKCSKCNRYFSTKFNFERHPCDRKVFTKNQQKSGSFYFS